jgi:signal transduction histidine kinase
MNINYDVDKLIKLIKTLPIAIAIIFSLTTTYLVLINNIEKHKENIKSIKYNFLQTQKTVIKKEVLRTVKQINYQKNLAEEKLKNDIKTRVTTVSKIIDNLYKEHKNKTKDELTKIIKDSIRTIRFNEGRGYFFIYTMDGTNVLFPTSPELEGQNMWNLKDSKGGYSIRSLSNIAKEKDEGFLSWYWFKPSTGKLLEQKMYKKIGYTKYIKELNWFVGTGEYVENFEENMQKELIKEISEIRFGKNGYIFIHTYSGVCLTNKDKNKLGKHRYDLKDSKGEHPLNKMIEVAKKGEGYVNYETDIDLITNTSSNILSYVVGIDDWQWLIRAETSISDIDSILMKKELEFKEKLYKSIVSIVITSIILTLILIYTMLKLLTIIESEFAKYEKSLKNHILESHKKDKLLFEQSKLASMGEMIANIAHQWRQPLSVISTAATGMKMQKEFGCLSDTVFNNSCDAINNNAQYLSKTIDDFKNFIKGDNRRTDFNLSNTISVFLNLVDSSIKANKIKIILNIEENIIISGHENELSQCFMNIFNNAKDALKDVEEGFKELYISIKKADDTVIVEIKDNAGGILNDALPKIFEPYFTTKHKSQGTGLGLHMTYTLIVEGMHGTIEASNVFYKDSNNINVRGALFKIVLPLK